MLYQASAYTALAGLLTRLCACAGPALGGLGRALVPLMLEGAAPGRHEVLLSFTVRPQQCYKLLYSVAILCSLAGDTVSEQVSAWQRS